METSDHWLYKEIFRFEIEVGFTRNLQNVTVISQRNHAKSKLIREVNVFMATIASLPGVRLFCAFGLFWLVCGNV